MLLPSRRQRHHRRGAVLVESVFAYSVVLLLTFGVIVVAMGMYRYQQVAAVACEGARWASVHGGQYAQETGNAMATSSTVYSTAMSPLMVGLDTSHVTYTVVWADPGEMPTYTAGGNTVANTVTVTVTYNWIPELYLSPVTLTSRAVATIQY
jgi:Flp pilus assembly protein TadG